MRKFFFTLLLAFIGSVWTISHAICMATGESGYSMLDIYSGTLQGASLPCESASEEEPCVPCATVALSAENGLYYLTGLSEEWQNFCDREFLTPHNAMNMSYSYHALLSGTWFERGESQFIQVNYMQVNKIELWRSENWLLGGWKVEKETVCNGDGFGGVLTRTITDEILYMFYDQSVVHTVNGATYDNLLTYSTQNQSNGTMLLTVKDLFDTVEREHPWDGGNSPITIYKLTDSELEWQYDSYGGDEGPVTHYQFLRRCQTNRPFAEGERVVLSGSLTESFRECTIEECPTCYGIFATSAYPVSFYSLTVTDAQIIDQLNHMPTGKQFTIEGVWLICKDTPFIEVSAIYETTSDTIPLYVNDGPGSTTVTPVDPNQVVATLNDNLLTIREQSGEEVTYSLAVTPISHAPARHELPEAQKEVSAGNFRNSVAVQLSEDGSYTLTLSKAGWENDIYGTFDYTASGLQPIAATDAPARKLLRNGQLLIQQGDKIFTLTGVQTK